MRRRVLVPLLVGLIFDTASCRRRLEVPEATYLAADIVTRVAGLPAGMAPGLALLLVADLDHNGAFDIVVAGSATSRVLLGSGGEGFEPLPAPLALGARAAADLGGDGRLEILGVAEGGRAVRAKSRGAKAYHWQAVRPRSATATGDQRINSFGVGGLGEATRAEIVRDMARQRRPSPQRHQGHKERTSAVHEARLVALCSLCLVVNGPLAGPSHQLDIL